MFGPEGDRGDVVVALAFDLDECPQLVVELLARLGREGDLTWHPASSMTDRARTMVVKARTHTGSGSAACQYSPIAECIGFELDIDAVQERTHRARSVVVVGQVRTSCRPIEWSHPSAHGQTRSLFVRHNGLVLHRLFVVLLLFCSSWETLRRA